MGDILHAAEFAEPRLAFAAQAADRRFGGGSLKSQMKSADRSGATYAVIVGDDEAAAGEVTLRPLRADADGERPPQRRVPRDALVAELRADDPAR